MHKVDAHGTVDDSQSDLRITLRVEGRSVDGATSYGNLRYVQAIDDAGTDLHPNREAVPDRDERFVMVRGRTLFLDRLDRQTLEQTVLHGLQQAPRKGFDVQLALRPPVRRATKIKHLRGEFHALVGGSEKLLFFKNFKSDVGKTLTDPILKTAGLKIQILPPNEGDSDRSVRMRFVGNLHAIVDADIVSSNGKSVTDGSSSSTSGDSRTTEYNLTTSLEDSLTLKLRVVVDQKTVSVPFDLRDIPLP